jgi:Zn-dependent peptidase ImmA (M78 family)
MTLRIKDAVAIVLNPQHSKQRQASTLTHEISHVELRHVPTRVDLSPSGILLISEYAEDAEAEADWLSGAMLLPRDALLLHRANGVSPDEIASIYGVSRALCDWRLRMTGVDLQRRRAASRAH